MKDFEISMWYAEAVNILEGIGYNASVRENYSGRGMFGESVPAIVTDAPAVFVGFALCHTIEPYYVIVAQQYLPDRSDNMGRDDMVYYRGF